MICLAILIEIEDNQMDKVYLVHRVNKGDENVIGIATTIDVAKSIAKTDIVKRLPFNERNVEVKIEWYNGNSNSEQVTHAYYPGYGSYYVQRVYLDTHGVY